MLAGLLRAEDLSFSNEPLATLGDSLVLSYVHLSFTALGGDDVGPFGAVDGDLIAVMEVDGAGRQRRAELFGVDHLGEAIARLYQLHAELQPEGPARSRAAATARSVAAVLGEAYGQSSFRAILASDLEFVDHQQLGFGRAHGADTVRRENLVLHEVADQVSSRVDELLALRSDGLVASRTIRGTDRASGGVFEREHVELWCFGSDGLLTHLEHFDCAAARAALARFEELAAVSSPAAARRLRPNAATANAARADAAILARDVDAIRTVFAEHAEIVHHPTGAVYDEQGSLSNWRSLFQASDLRFATEALATVGDSLALCRTRMSFAEIVSAEANFIGATAKDDYILIEVDARGRRTRAEFFAADRLGDAVVRMYERYAEILPPGPARERAAISARAATALLHPFDADYSTVLARDLVFADHRPLGLGSLSGVEEFIRWNRSLIEMAEQLSIRYDEVLGARPDMLLVSTVVEGRIRASGASFETPIVHLFRTGVDGKATRIEWFEPAQLDEAFASFDAFCAERPELERRVRSNAATENAARHDAAIAARDVDAFLSLIHDDLESVHHPTGTRYGKEGAVARVRGSLRAESPTSLHRPLATLGDSLALCHFSASASGQPGTNFDVGAWDIATINLIEADAQGRRRRLETFAENRLGDALARLYERYAELLPDGLERAHAAATARSVATLAGLLTPDRLSADVDPAIDFVDHRLAGFGSLHGAEALARAIATAFEVADGLSEHCADVLAVQPDTLLVSWVTAGRVRQGGGEFEWPHLRLCRVGPTGRFTRVEAFAVDQAREALARFDELSAAQPKACIENVATRAMAAAVAAIQARDWDRFDGTFDPEFRSSDRRRLLRLELDRAQFLALMRAVFQIDQRISIELLATRGSRLSLVHYRWLASEGSVGPSDGEFLMISEMGHAGRQVAQVSFDADDLDAAYAELDRRFAAGEAAPYAEIWEQFRLRCRAVATRDWDQLTALLPPDLVTEDHRPIRWGVLHSRDEYLVMFRALGDLAPDVTARLDHVLGLDERGAWASCSDRAAADGGAFEMPVVTVNEVGADGRVQRLHVYDLEQLDEARACYAALPGRSSAPHVENLATRALLAGEAAMKAKDWDRFSALFQARFRNSDRRRMVQLELDRTDYLDFMRSVIDSDRNTAGQVLATRGSRLALFHMRWLASDGDVGPSDGEFLMIVETDEQGSLVGAVNFDADALGAANTELDRRYHDGEPGPR